MHEPPREGTEVPCDNNPLSPSPLYLVREARQVVGRYSGRRLVAAKEECICGWAVLPLPPGQVSIHRSSLS